MNDKPLETVFLRCNAPIQPRALGKGRIRYVRIQNTFNLMNGNANTSEVMVGNAIAQPFQLLPGAETPDIYADDLDRVWIRVRDTAVGLGTPVDVTVIVYKEKEF